MKKIVVKVNGSSIWRSFAGVKRTETKSVQGRSGSTYTPSCRYEKHAAVNWSCKLSGRFLVGLADVCEPLRQLSFQDSDWDWNEEQGTRADNSCFL